MNKAITNPYKDVSSKNLIDELQQLYSAIYISECFNTKDMVRFYKAIQELEKRGYKVDETNSFIFAKKLYS